MTYLDMVNSVLTRLREDTVSTVNQNSYSSMIAQFVNETKREVEDAWDWTFFRKPVSVSTTSGTKDYTLTGAGDRFKVRSVFNTSQGYEIFPVNDYFMQKNLANPNQQISMPAWYLIHKVANSDPNVTLYPIPETSQNYQFNLVIPQSDLVNDGDIVQVSGWPVILGAWSKAIQERGEDNGQTPTSEEVKYHDALANAISMDANLVDLDLVWNQV